MQRSVSSRDQRGKYCSHIVVIMIMIIVIMIMIIIIITEYSIIPLVVVSVPVQGLYSTRQQPASANGCQMGCMLSHSASDGWHGWPRRRHGWRGGWGGCIWGKITYLEVCIEVNIDIIHLRIFYFYFYLFLLTRRFSHIFTFQYYKVPNSFNRSPL